MHTRILPTPFSSNTEILDTTITPTVNPNNPTPLTIPTINSPSSPTKNPTLRHSTRTRHAPTYLQDFHRALTSLADTTSTKVKYPLHYVLSYSRLSPSHKHFIMSITTSTEPSSYVEASRFDYWIKVMQAELKALQQN